ncbi:PH domain-containing protein [Williamsia muralis]|uniref:PH (Pleckstrin Homology) domain-containing protein n=1 Tax=Williamsia marianensis TaxID=85044 RepID=A0A495K0M1_WILMA|nr:PH domain-containing protein [Williamsia muralis]RKR94793.1 PH (Pleckstrin Homology) domain-containing protein [Williamsia muralis]
MSETESIELPAVFRITPVAYFAAFMMAVTSLALAGASLRYLGWTLVVPILLALWIHRLRTIVTEDGVTAVSLRGRRSATWDQIAGLQFPKWGAVRAIRTDKSKLVLPAITFRDLPRLSAASRGRIPDPYAIDSPEQERIAEVEEPTPESTSSTDGTISDNDGQSGTKPGEGTTT